MVLLEKLGLILEDNNLMINWLSTFQLAQDVNFESNQTLGNFPYEQLFLRIVCGMIVPLETLVQNYFNFWQSLERRNF